MNFFGKFCALGVSVILTFAVLWLPFAIYPRASLSTKFHLDGIASLEAIFPFQRGLFEDKVANIWFSLSVKPLSIRSRISPDLLPLAALLLTLVMILPACFMLYRVGQRNTQYSPKKNLEFLLWGSVSTSLAFFLASFQVHEKGILISLAPLSLLALDANGFVIWFSTVATWSLWPLLVIDRLCEAYVCCLVIFLCINAMTRPTQLSGEVTFLRSNLATVAAVLSLAAMLSISSLVEFTWLRIVLYFLPGNDMGNVDEIQYYFIEIEHSFKKRSHSSGKVGGILLFIIFWYCRNIRGSILTLYPSNDTSRCILLQLFSAGKESDYFIPNSDHLERAQGFSARANLNLSAKNSDRLPLADGLDDDAVAASDETNTTPCSWEDGKVWRETEQALVALGILVKNDSDNESKELTREVIIDKVPQLLRLPTDQIVESASFFVGNSTEESPKLKVLLQLDPSLLTYTISQLAYAMTYLSNMMFRGDRTAAIQMIQSQCVISPSMGLSLLKVGVDGGIEETRISSLLSSAGQSSGRAIKGVVGDMSKGIREWKRVKGGKNSLG
ncbi:dolichyl pyrophosphate Man9GlcNAc2 alpha-1,3-glucosyltransferase [Skeletonema marinoi]|uniref:Alpha-1,3-glucosyltransferase n=1 Tax=Skeletonema marinoi TaxID=267567 RepID=A0AAD8Y5C9_9STRA|nr:dolichyl pyrophosphate Man9GlcNAc2 alpha-1,3-glucosyltransferase [Skeletonema marinoi]